MNLRLLFRLPLTAVALMMCFGAAPVAQATAPRDLSGIWMNDNTLDETMKREGRVRMTEAERKADRRGPAVEHLTPAYRAKYDALQAERARLAEGAESCAWPGMPGIMTYPFPFEIVQTPKVVYFLFEGHSQVRRIFMDRREHLPFDELDPTYNGDSIGRWEGDQLIIHTTGFNTQTQVRGLPHSESMVIEERVTWRDDDTIELRMSITDAEAFVKPVEMAVVYSQRPDWRIREYSCFENNRDAPDATGQRTGGVVGR
ncbi:MAG: hypothetical protein RL026_2500 [Pseudomonadota bacterium]